MGLWRKIWHFGFDTQGAHKDIFVEFIGFMEPRIHQVGRADLAGVVP
jgi:hypothetical protein